MTYLKRVPLASLVLLSIWTYGAINEDPHFSAQQQLFRGAQKGNLEQVKKALAQGADVYAVDPKTAPMRITAIYYAVTEGHTHILRYLVSVGTALRIEERGILEAAATRGRVETVEYLLSLGADVDEQSIEEGMTPLMAAVQNGYWDVVQTLVKEGADLTLKNQQDQIAQAVGLAVPPYLLQQADYQLINTYLERESAQQSLEELITFEDDDFDALLATLALEREEEEHARAQENPPPEPLG